MSSTIEFWKLVTLLVTVPAGLFTLWLIFVTAIKPFIKQWLKELFKDETAAFVKKLDETHVQTMANKDMGPAYMDIAKAQTATITASVNALAAAHNTAVEFGKLSKMMEDVKSDLGTMQRSVDNIRGYMKGMGMDRRTGDRDG